MTSNETAGTAVIRAKQFLGSKSIVFEDRGNKGEWSSDIWIGKLPENKQIKVRVALAPGVK